MGRTYSHKHGRDIRIRIRSIKRDRPDIKRLSRYLIELALAELEKEAKLEHRQPSQAAIGKQAPK